MSTDSGQPILILGMHRSGTSFLARLVQALGVFIGDDLVGPQKGNPRGHFEARPVLEFHQRLIAARQGPGRHAFDEGMLVQEPFTEAFSEEENRLALELLEAIRRPGPWGWKEPRTCLFLQDWMQLLPSARQLVVYRHPLEVQQSLLRRGHWDLALFPDQAIRAYQTYNTALLGCRQDAFVFNANAGFARLPELAGRLARHFGLELPAQLPEFHEGEFKGLRVSRSLHRLFAVCFPEAAAVFDQLQERAAIPYAWVEREDDPALEQAAAALAVIVDGLPAAGRAFLTPLLDWLASGRDPGLLPAYGALGAEIGEHIRAVKKWNEEAAVIYEDNERLAAECKRLGDEYARQQEFLARQTATQAKVWEELKWTGESWKKQRDFIDKITREKEALQARLDALTKPPGGGDAGA